MFSQPFQRYLHLKYLTLKNLVKATEYNIRNGPIRWQISTCIKSFLVNSHRFRFSHFKFCDLENVGQGHGGQHSPWHHSIANT